MSSAPYLLKLHDDRGNSLEVLGNQELRKLSQPSMEDVKGGTSYGPWYCVEMLGGCGAMGYGGQVCIGGTYEYWNLTGCYDFGMEPVCFYDHSPVGGSC